MADIEVIKRLVVEAGGRALARFGGVAYEYKADQSVVTEVDCETERFLRDSLEEIAPDYAFLGEEYGWQGPHDSSVWVCDPIDGTTNYVRGLPHWCVSVGLLEGCVPVLGVIYLPRMDELFWAERGKGAFCNDQSIRSIDYDCLHPEDTLCLTSNSMKTLNTEALTCRIRGLGSIASELAYTARGNLAATVGLREGIIDISAALCIGAEAGCVIRHLTGDALDLAELMEARYTLDHFVFGPPNLVTLLQDTLHKR